MIAIAGVVIICGWLARIPWTQPAGAPFSVALLQGNVAQNEKWAPEFQRATLEMYTQMSREHWDARLVIWPETAIPAFYHQVKETWLAGLQEEAQAHGADMLIGIPVINLETQRYYNAIVGMGERPGLYFKRHLVPFGEFLPLRPIFGFILEVLQFPLADFAPGGDDQPLLHAAGYPLAASICYEDVFGDESRLGLPEAAYLVNVTNDAWFGDSIAPRQHLQMARMRALESGRYLLRATNTGVTAIISSKGQTIAQAPLFQRAAVTAMATPMQGATPYIRWGDAPVIVVLVLMLGGAWKRKFMDLLLGKFSRKVW
jgi:apolipoprotein N-acyltransferase